MSAFTAKTFSLLAELEQNNNKEWFAENKSTYEQHAREPFATLLSALTEALAQTEYPFVGSEKTMFRANRDVRFSTDKSPYSAHVSGVLTPTGTKREAGPLVYVHIDSAGGFAVAGLYHPDTSRLEQLRGAMIEKPESFEKVLEQLAKAHLTLDDSEATKTMPRGFTDFADHRFANQIKLKNLMVRKDLTKDQLSSESIVTELTSFAAAASPLIGFIHNN